MAVGACRVVRTSGVVAVSVAWACCLIAVHGSSVPLRLLELAPGPAARLWWARFPAQLCSLWQPAVPAVVSGVVAMCPLRWRRSRHRPTVCRCRGAGCVIRSSSGTTRLLVQQLVGVAVAHPCRAGAGCVIRLWCGCCGWLGPSCIAVAVAAVGSCGGGVVVGAVVVSTIVAIPTAVVVPAAAATVVVSAVVSVVFVGSVVVVAAWSALRIYVGWGIHSGCPSVPMRISHPSWWTSRWWNPQVKARLVRVVSPPSTHATTWCA